MEGVAAQQPPDRQTGAFDGSVVGERL